MEINNSNPSIQSPDSAYTTWLSAWQDIQAAIASLPITTPDYQDKIDHLKALLPEIQANKDAGKDTDVSAIDQTIKQIVDGGGSNPKEQIQKDYDAAKTEYDSLTKALAADKSLLAQLGPQIADLEKQIEDLKGKIGALTDPDQIKAANDALKDAQNKLSSLEGARDAAQADVGALTSALSSATSTLDDLKALLNKPNPTQNDADQADKDSKTITDLEKLQTQFGKDFPSSSVIDAVKAAIQKTSDIINPDYAKQIDQDDTDAQAVLAALKALLAQDQSQLSDLDKAIKDLESQIASLQSQIDNCTDPAKKQQAQTDLDKAKGELATLKSQYTQLSGDISGLQSSLNTATTYADQIHQLAQSGAKDAKSAKDAAGALTSLKNAQGSFNTQFDTDMATANTQKQAITAILSVVNQDLNPPVKITGQTAYLDMGTLSGCNPQYLQEIIDKLKAGGITDIRLSFAKLNKPDEWMAGGKDTFEQVVKDAKAAGMHVQLAFGGALGGGDWDTGSDPKGLADKLAAFAQQYGIDGVDFDYEEGTASPSPDFFKELHAKFKEEGEGRTMTLTVDGAPSWSVNGPLKDLFVDEATGKSVFNDYFDALNLMLYNPSQEYIDNKYYSEDGKSCLELWLKEIAPKYGIPLSNIHIGFTNQSNSVFDGDTGTRGGDAAEVYQRELAKLGIDPSQLGNTFWWPDESKGYPKGIEDMIQEINDFQTHLKPALTTDQQSAQKLYDDLINNFPLEIQG